MSDIPTTIPTVLEFCSFQYAETRGSVTKWVDQWRDEITVVVYGEGLVALSSVCIHHGGEMEVYPNQKKFICKWHGWEFDIETGQCLNYKTNSCLRHYPCEVKNGMVEVRLP